MTAVCYAVTVGLLSDDVLPEICPIPKVGLPTQENLSSGNEREELTHPERVKLTHLGLQNGRSGQER